MEEFIEMYGIHAFYDLMDVLVDDKILFKDCEDDLCDDEGCVLYKAFQKYLESKS